MFSKHCTLALKIAFVFFTIMMVYRVAFLIYFVPTGEHLTFSNVISTLFLGARFDARWAAIPSLFFLVLSAFRIFSPLHKKWARHFWIILFTMIALLLYLILCLDFGNFAYLGNRLTAYIFTLMGNKSEAWGMVWESYPVVWILLAIIGSLALTHFRFKKILKAPSAFRGFPTSKAKRISSFIIVFLIFGIAIFGRFGQYPLRWSAAYDHRSDFMGKTALNPFETVYNTLKFRNEVPFDMKQVRAGYPVFRERLGMTPATSTDSISFKRYIPIDSSRETRNLNVVILISESFAAHMSSSFGNALNTSPNFDALAKQGVLFDHCFVARRGTAYGVFSTTTGVPDFEGMSTATANPNLVDQRILFNSLEGYNRMYFIGGSLSWANVRAVLTHNMKNLKTYEELDYKSSRTDIWGVGDFPMLMEASDIYAQQKKPFCSIIQLADNHKPYSIPKEAVKAGFVVDNEVSQDTLYKWGFRSIEEYNAYRCFDFSLGAFFDKAKKEKYFENTLFVVIGDHGLDSKMAYQFPKDWAKSGLTNIHTPLLFYCPKYLAPKRISSLAAQVDVMPSIMGILNKPYTYSALGRDLFNPTIQQDSNAIVFARVAGFRGEAITAYSKNIYVQVSMDDYSQRTLYNFSGSTLSAEAENQLRDSLGNLAIEYYNMARYVARNNKN